MMVVSFQDGQAEERRRRNPQGRLPELTFPVALLPYIDSNLRIIPLLSAKMSRIENSSGKGDK